MMRANILAGNGKWSFAIIRLCYAAYYALMALLLSADLKHITHNRE